MYLIDKKTRTRQQVLSNNYQNILFNSEQCADKLKEELAVYLYEIKEKYWIECNCNSDTSFLVIYSSKYTVSVRCKERDKHDTLCAFFIKNLDLSLNKAGNLITMRKVRTYDLYAMNQSYTSNPAANINNDNISNTSRLGQALYTFYTDSKCNIYEFGKNYKNLKQQLKAFSDSVELPCNKISKDLLLKRVYRYSISEKSVEYAKQDLNRVKFPHHLKPFILFSTRSSIVREHSFSVAREVDKKWSEVRFEVKSGIKKPSSWISYKNSNPFFLLATYIHNTETQQYEIKDSFAIPIYGMNNIMPVESHYERQVLDLLVQLISSRSNKEEYIIEKPLFATKTDSGEIYRPDFVITTTGKVTLPIFIEVLGSTSDEFNKQKDLIAARAKEYCCAYISIKGYALERDKLSFIENIKSHL